MTDFRRYVIVRKGFKDLFLNYFRKYYRVIIQSPIVISKIGSNVKFTKWLEDELNKEYIRHYKIDEVKGIPDAENNQVYYYTYMIYKYDLREFENHVIRKYNKEYEVNNPIICHALDVNFEVYLKKLFKEGYKELSYEKLIK
jgi:hypothetical protein